MLAHCVNPDCRTSLRSFSEGRLFQFEIVSISVAAIDEDRAPFDEKPHRQTSHFWLCGNCAARMSVTLEPLSGLQLTPLDRIAVIESEISVPGPQPQQPSHC